MTAGSVWLVVLANTLLLLVEIAAVAAPLALVLIGRYAEVSGTSVPAWTDVTRPETQRVLILTYAALALLLILERLPRARTGWPWRRRGATMARPGPRLVPAPPAVKPEGSAFEKGSARNGRQVTESNAEEEPAKEGRAGEESQVAAPLG